MDNTVGSLSQVQRSIVQGSLLGDGYLRIVKGRKDAFLEVNHSIKQSDYVQWKYEQLSNIVKSPPKERKTNGKRIACRFFTQQHPYLTKLHSQFYKEGKKTISNITLDSISLAVWYMDDGSKCRSSDIYFNTQQFDINSQMKLLESLAMLGLQGRLNRDKNYYRIRLLKSSISHLQKTIGQFLIPSMRYKLEI